MTSIFTDNNITFSECSQGSERNIFEISDRSGDEGEHLIEINNEEWIIYSEILVNLGTIFPSHSTFSSHIERGLTVKSHHSCQSET